jgi:hypothetical protein
LHHGSTMAQCRTVVGQLDELELDLVATPKTSGGRPRRS